MNNVCLHCGETREAVKKYRLFCATETNNENGREVDQEWPRHRFTPFSKRELEAIAKDEAEYVKQMGEFADYINSGQAEKDWQSFKKEHKI